MDNSYRDRSFYYSEIPKNSGLGSLTRSEVIALLILTKFTRHLMQVRHLVHYSRWKKNGKNSNISFKILTPIISAFRNYVAKLRLHSLHRSGEIINNVLKT
jgi:hypothetical protein